MLNIDDLKECIEVYGCEDIHEIQHTTRYYLPKMKQFVYVNKQAGNNSSGLIIHPRFYALKGELLQISGVRSSQKYHHLSSMGKFPKRLNRGKDEIPYGIPFGFDSKTCLVEFLNRLSQLPPTYERDEVEEINEVIHEFDNLSPTEKKNLVKSRIGQGKYRDKLVDLWKSCSVSGCTEISILRASHIKPWRDSDNIERLDVYNGLLLTPNLDVTFDKGLITFSDSGEISISTFLNMDTRDKLGIDEGMKIRSLEKQHKVFLKYHRNHIFQT